MFREVKVLWRDWRSMANLTRLLLPLKLLVHAVKVRSDFVQSIEYSCGPKVCLRPGWGPCEQRRCPGIGFCVGQQKENWNGNWNVRTGTSN